jgi:hypothetical protein
MWFQELVAPDEVAFEADVFLLRKVTAESLRAGQPATPIHTPEPEPGPVITPTPKPGPVLGPKPEPAPSKRTLRLFGNVPPEVWNRLGTKVLPKLRTGSDLKIGLEFSVTISVDAANGLTTELRQILQELGLADAIKVEYLIRLVLCAMKRLCVGDRARPSDLFVAWRSAVTTCRRRDNFRSTIDYLSWRLPLTRAEA